MAGASFNSGNKPEITSNDGNIPKIENENKPDIDYDNETEIDDKAQAEIRHYEFTVNMSCGGCSAAVERALKKLPGVIKHKADHKTRTVEVWCTLAFDEVLSAIKKTGKEVVKGEELPVLPNDLSHLTV